MKIKVLASGSKGNSTLINCDTTKILIDAGITYTTLKELLLNENIIPDDLDGILITHNHNDHIKGLATLIKKHHIPVYIPEGQFIELKKIIEPTYLRFINDDFHIKDIEGELIHTSHDAPSPVGYILSYQERTLVYVTDTGYINSKYLSKIKNKSIYIMESNHDEKMLMDGPYPYYLKQRILSDNGHLSNNRSATYLKDAIGDNTKYIVLAHLSETNNNEQKAYETLTNKLEEIEYQKPEIIIAHQTPDNPLIEV